MHDNSDRDARLYLLRVVEHPSPQTRAYATEHGAIRTSSDLRSGMGPTDVLEEIHTSDSAIAGDIELLNSGKASLLVPDHADWPITNLSDLEAADRPFAPLGTRVYVTGRTYRALGRGYGSARAASSHGSSVDGEFADTMSQHRVTIINGGAYGVEEAALRAVLANSGRTIVVLPCGIDQVYPRANTELFDRIIDNGGLVVSEYAPDRLPSRAPSLARGRLIAAFGSVTVVVEAGKRSGALALAGMAKSYGRPFLGVPGSIYATMSTGVHGLIRSGQAQLAAAADDAIQIARPER